MKFTLTLLNVYLLIDLVKSIESPDTIFLQCISFHSIFLLLAIVQSKSCAYESLDAVVYNASLGGVNKK